MFNIQGDTVCIGYFSVSWNTICKYFLPIDEKIGRLTKSLERKEAIKLEGKHEEFKQSLDLSLYINKIPL